MLEYTVFQVSGTASAKVQGLGRERVCGISGKLNQGLSELVQSRGWGAGERQSGKRLMAR